MNSVTCKSIAKIGAQKANKPFRIMVLGQSAVGKSAMIVRYITKRFIGEYDPNLEKVYTFSTIVDNELVVFEILDSAGQMENEFLESNIRWAEAFILLYSVTDKCSFEEINRLKFLINYNKRRKKINKDGVMDAPVILVGNKTDLINDRMVTTEEGQKRSRDINCACFHEISVRESIDQVDVVFRDVCRFWRVWSPKLKRSKSDSIRLSWLLHTDVDSLLNHDNILPICNHDFQGVSRRFAYGHSESSYTKEEEETETKRNMTQQEPFRTRAKTDGNLFMTRSKKQLPPKPLPVVLPFFKLMCRRNSISLQGNANF
ncbi:unnamed protein product [Diamesa hyperborea]